MLHIHAIDYHGDFSRGESLCNEAIPESGGDRVDVAHPVIEEAPQEFPAWSKLTGCKLRMLTVEDPVLFAGRGKGGVDERTQVVGVNHVRREVADVRGQRADGALERIPLLCSRMWTRSG